MTDTDRVIAKRVRRVRFANELTQSAFAYALGISLDRLASVEYERTPLTVKLADKISAKFNISMIWLAEGEGRMGPFLGFIMQICPNLDGSEALSKSYNSDVKKRFLAKCKSDYSGFVGTISRWPEAPKEQQMKLAELLVSQLLSKLEEAFAGLSVDGKNKLWNAVDAALRGYLEDWDQEQPNEKTRDSPKKLLTDAATPEKLADVKTQLPSLLARLNQATSKAGKMSALARFLGVPLASVSRWLAGKREPGGEITLKLLRWVEQQELQK